MKKLILLVLLVGGCYGHFDSPQAAYQSAQTEYDKYTGQSNVELRADGITWLRFGKTAEGKRVYGIAREVLASDWIFPYACFDDRGTKLNCARTDSSVSGGMTSEIVTVIVDRPYFDAHKASGIHFEIKGKRGDREVEVTPNAIAGFLMKVDAT